MSKMLSSGNDEAAQAIKKWLFGNSVLLFDTQAAQQNGVKRQSASCIFSDKQVASIAYILHVHFPMVLLEPTPDGIIWASEEI